MIDSMSTDELQRAATQARIRVDVATAAIEFARVLRMLKHDDAADIVIKVAMEVADRIIQREKEPSP